MNLIPTLDRVVIRREDKEQTSKGGIVIPGQAQKETNYGTVLAVGPGAFNPDGSRRPVGLLIGDRVFFTDYHTASPGGSDDQIVIADEEDILAVVKG